jgi:hypothetical protein
MPAVTLAPALVVAAVSLLVPVDGVAGVAGVGGVAAVAGSVPVDGVAGVAGVARWASPCVGCANAALERPRVAASAAKARVFDI